MKINWILVHVSMNSHYWNQESEHHNHIISRLRRLCNLSSLIGCAESIQATICCARVPFVQSHPQHLCFTGHLANFHNGVEIWEAGKQVVWWSAWHRDDGNRADTHHCAPLHSFLFRCSGSQRIIMNHRAPFMLLSWVCPGGLRFLYHKVEFVPDMFSHQHLL